MRRAKRSMPIPDNARPAFLPGEAVILEEQGGYRETHRTGWRPSQCFLTNKRFIVYLRPSIRMEIPLENIKELGLERHYYAMKTRDALRIIYQRASTSKNLGKVLLITNRTHEWKKKIHHICFLKVDRETVRRIAAQLDDDGGDILWYLWENGHARINRLAELIRTPNHMHVLMVIRETINPVAEKELGCAILSFEKRKVDPETGEIITFSWWLVGRKDRFLPNHERLVDIFDEGERIRVIMEVKGVVPEDLKLDFRGDRVTVRCHKLGASLRTELPLEAKVRPGDYRLQIRNNFLEIRFNKETEHGVATGIQ